MTAILPREELMTELDLTQQVTNHWIRKMVVDGRRMDVLAEQVLGFTVAPNLHGRIINHQAANRRSMTLAYRQCGKTTCGDITPCIGAVLANPEIGILLTSKTQGQANSILHEIKGHFETNETLHEIFGSGWIGDHKWTESQIIVGRRKKSRKEPTIMSVGVGGAIPSKHVEVIICDDLVDEASARTLHQRDLIEDWYYKVLDPCLKPYKAEVPWSGTQHFLGTVYHWDDLYARLQIKGWDKRLLVIPAIGPDGETVPWPEQHSLDWFLEKRDAYGRARFDSQYQCSAEAMKGKIFRWDDMRFESNRIPDPTVFIGVDPAISQSADADKFAICVIAVERPQSKLSAQEQKMREVLHGKSVEEIRKLLTSPESELNTLRGDVLAERKQRIHARPHLRVLDAFHDRLVFQDQTKKIIEMADRWGASRIGVESNGYQLAQYQALKDRRPDLTVVPVPTTKSKPERGWDLASRFESGLISFQVNSEGQSSTGVNQLIDQLLSFPDTNQDDLFDALDIAVWVTERRARGRSGPVGLI